MENQGKVEPTGRRPEFVRADVIFCYAIPIAILRPRVAVEVGAGRGLGGAAVNGWRVRPQVEVARHGVHEGMSLLR